MSTEDGAWSTEGTPEPAPVENGKKRPTGGTRGGWVFDFCDAFYARTEKIPTAADVWPHYKKTFTDAKRTTCVTQLSRWIEHKGFSETIKQARAERRAAREKERAERKKAREAREAARRQEEARRKAARQQREVQAARNKAEREAEAERKRIEQERLERELKSGAVAAAEAAAKAVDQNG